jgi:hypothetical protein
MTSEWKRQYNGWDIPDYHKKVRRGDLLPFTPWGCYEYTAATEGICDVIVGNLPGTRFHVVPGMTQYTDWRLEMSEVLSYAPSEDLKYLCTEAMAKIYGNGFDALTNIAELTSVVKMFKSVAKRLADFIHFLPYYWKKLTYKELKKAGKDVNNDWLSYRYGWRILVYDMLNVHKVFFDLTNKLRRYSERTGYTTHSTFDDAWTTFHTHYTLTHAIHREIDVSVRGSVVSDIDFPRFQFNPIQTAWEKIPLSFVVDWVLGVGNWIAGLTYAFRPGNYVAATGYRIEVTQAYNNYISSKETTFRSGDRYQSGGAHVVYTKRIPSEISMIPHLNVRLNNLKVLDLIALVVQRIAH